MKNIVCALSLVLFLASCNHVAVEKPSNLIEEDVMENIIYDLTLLEAIKSQNPYGEENKTVNPKEYIYKKYHTDSIQFTESNRYYVSQIEQYKKMYDHVTQRMESQNKAAGATEANKDVKPAVANPEAGQVQ